MTELLILAHGSIEGVGDLWNGLLHPLRSPAHLLVLLTLGLLGGQNSRNKPAIIAFLAASFAGLCCIGGAIVPEPPAWLPSLISGLLGVLAAISLTTPVLAECLLFAVAGLVLGLDSAPDGATGWALFKILLGVWVGLAVLVLNLVNYAAMCPKKRWIAIAFRILGSWVAAISALSLALSLKR